MKQKLPFKTTTPLTITLAVAAGLASLIGIAYTLSTWRFSQPPPSPTPTVGLAKTQAVSALGRLEPQGEVIQVASSPNLGGAKIAKLLVEEGDWVEPGQVIALLDNYSLKKKAVQRAREDVKVADSNLEIVKAGAKTGEIKAQQAEIERLRAEMSGEISSNQATIARLEAELAGEKQVQTATIARLVAELANAGREFQRYQQLAKDGAISESELDARRLTLETAREKVQEARANLHQTTTTLTEEIREAQADSRKTTDTLQEQIREAKAELNRISEVRNVDVQKAQAEVGRAIAVFQEAEEDLQLSIVKAPFRGQVLKINTYPGENVNQEEGIVELGRTDRMMAIAEVYENDIGRVHLGQRAEIESENATFVGKLTGTVQQIGLQIGKRDVLESDPAADVDVRVIEVKILLTPESSRQVTRLTNAKVIVKILP